MKTRRAILWLTRLTLGAVFFFNVSCALAFVARPAVYTPSFEVNGVPGETLVRGMGILFLMWNASYPLAIWDPRRYRWLLAIIIAQQGIGLAGETWMLLTLPAGHETLAMTGYRFVAFDGGGLVAMLATFALLQLSARRAPGCAPGGSVVDCAPRDGDQWTLRSSPDDSTTQTRRKLWRRPSAPGPPAPPA